MSAVITTPAAPSTPATPFPAAPTPPTGTWQHPRMSEIERRREANEFTRRKAIRTMVLLSALLLTFFAPGQWIKSLLSLLISSTYSSLSLRALRLVLIYYSATSLSPFWTAKDTMEDIPLTPTQRKLLGLTPSSSSIPPSAIGGGAYITPPRYTRSTTPRSGSSRAAVVGSSPLSGSAMGTPFSGSPLARKAMEGRRTSFSGSPSLQGSLFDESKNASPSSGMETFSPTGKSAGVQLNNKWLYQRGKTRHSGGIY